MAAKSSAAGGANRCPVCDAKSNNPNIGRDGQRRWLDATKPAPYMDAETVRRRNRASCLRKNNLLGKA